MFYDIFLSLCASVGKRPSNVADELGIARSTVSHWKKDSAPTDATIAKISAYFGVDPSYFRGKNVTRIPVLGTVPAGIPLEAIEDVVDWEEIPNKSDKEYFALKVKGDSMWPRFLEGDTVIVRKTPTCVSGDICVVYVNGYDATLKEVRINLDKSVSLIPENKNYPPRTFTRQEVEELPVIIAGVVVELRRKI